MRRALTTALVACALAWSVDGHAHNFIGAQACGSCHPFELEVWNKSAHARAHLSLTPAQLGDGRCASCHSNVMAALDQQGSETVGLGEVAVGQRDEKRSPLAQALHDPVLLGVQCEQCHGPGRLYAPSYVMRDRELSRALGLVDPTPASCRSCHTEGAPSLEAFDYATLWARIDHSKAARQRWTDAQQGSGGVGPDAARVGAAAGEAADLADGQVLHKSSAEGSISSGGRAPAQSGRRSRKKER